MTIDEANKIISNFMNETGILPKSETKPIESSIKVNNPMYCNCTKTCTNN